MNAIIGFSEMLELNLEGPLNEAQQNCVHYIRKSGDHLLGLINEVLDLAKIESGDLSLSIEPTNPLYELVGCLEMATSMAAKRNIEIEDRVTSTQLPYIMIDSVRFKQVLLNFVSNAIKYNRDKGRVILDFEIIEGKFLRFLVSDTGKGIPLEMQSELFKPFQRLGREASNIEGTGIGLTITKELLTRMGGNLGFESFEGKGSTFWFELPLAPEGSAALLGDVIEKEKTSLEFTIADGETEKLILYIEDNPENLKLMEKIISKIPNLNMLSAHNAEIGLELAEEKIPELILMDINLPGMNGIKAMNALKTNDKTREIPVVAISAAAMPNEIKRGMAAGFVDYLTKPIRIKKTLEVIKSVLEESN